MTQDQIMKLISSMTLEEKAAQMTQLAPVNFGFNCVTPLTGPDSGLRIRPEFSASIGSVLNCGSAEDMIRIQKEHLENDPHKIPLLFMADVVHGFKTVFPIPLAVGCSFSPENAREAAQIAAEVGLHHPLPLPCQEDEAHRLLDVLLGGYAPHPPGGGVHPHRELPAPAQEIPGRIRMVHPLGLLP